MNMIIEGTAAALLTGIIAFTVTCSTTPVKHKAGRHGHRHKVTRVEKATRMGPVDTYYPNRDWREYEPDYPNPQPTPTPLHTIKRKPVPQEL